MKRLRSHVRIRRGVCLQPGPSSKGLKCPLLGLRRVLASGTWDNL